MVFRVEVTARAERDLEAIASYVAERACSATPALQWFDEMAAAIRDLGRSPHRFAVEEDLTALRGREYRRRLVGNYRVVFRILEDTVVVDSVIPWKPRCHKCGGPAAVMAGWSRRVTRREQAWRAVVIAVQAD